MKKIVAAALLSLAFFSCTKTNNAPPNYAQVLGRMGVVMNVAYTCGHYGPFDNTGTITFLDDTSIIEYSKAAGRSITFSCKYSTDTAKISYLNACYTVKDSAKLASNIAGDAAGFPIAQLALHKLELVNYSSALLLAGVYGFPAAGITPSTNDYIMTH